MLVSYRDLREKMGSKIESAKKDPDSIADLMCFRARIGNYCLDNTVAIQLQRPAAVFVAGLLEWEKLGYHVNMDATGINILSPVTQKSFFRSPEEPAVKVSEATDEEKRQIAAGKIETQEQIVYKNDVVFDISQTDCPKSDYRKFIQAGYGDVPQQQLYDSMQKFAEACGFSVKICDIHSIGLDANYNPERMEIAISDKLGDTRQLSALCHELSHGLIQNWRTAPGAVAEFEAESLSAMLHTRMGLPIDASAHRRISDGYKKAGGTNLNLNECFRHTQKAYNFTVEKFEEQLVTALAPDRNMQQVMAMATLQSVNENFMIGLR